MAPLLQQNRSPWQRLKDHLLFPLNMWLDEETSCSLGLTPIDYERIRAALPHCRGKLLDVACGNNLLSRAYGQGVGADVHPYAEIDVRCDSAWLPFKDASFDSLSMLACLNHITRREETLRECFRVLRPQGKILITMIPAWVGYFSHRIRRRHDPDQLERGMKEEEDWGLSTIAIGSLLESAGFELVGHHRFMWALNHLYIGRKT
jgi:SAM-dependent methyltransferase